MIHKEQASKATWKAVADAIYTDEVQSALVTIEHAIIEATEQGENGVLVSIPPLLKPVQLKALIKCIKSNSFEFSDLSVPRAKNWCFRISW